MLTLIALILMIAGLVALFLSIWGGTSRINTLALGVFLWVAGWFLLIVAQGAFDGATLPT